MSPTDPGGSGPETRRSDADETFIIADEDVTFVGESDPQPVDWERLNRLRGTGAREPDAEVPDPTGVVRYRKKPVTVETMPWTGDNWAAVCRFTGAGGRYFPAATGGGGPTLDLWNSQERAWIRCPIGHSVVKGRLGEFYPISPAAIAETYEPAGSPDPAGDRYEDCVSEIRQAMERLEHFNDVNGFEAPELDALARAAYDAIAARLSAAAEVTG